MATRRNVIRKSNRTSHLLAAALLLGSAMAAGAQDTQLAAADARWTAWVGCWQASSRDAEAQGIAPSKALPVVCIVPAAGNATIDLITVSGGAPATERVDANGSRRAVNRGGCTGWERAEFSPDAKRIYLQSEHQCTGNTTRTSTGIMSMTPNGEWLDVQSVKVGTNNGVRVVHYGRVPVPAVLSADVKAALEGRSMATSMAVLAASDSVKVAEVIEATKRVDPLVVQTWLAQRGQGFNMDAKKLTQLANAKVPANVIDVMVALSYPQVFAVNLAQADGQIVLAAGNAQLNADDVRGDGPMVFMNWDPFYSSSYGYYSRYGYGGLGPYGYYPSNWYQGRPVVVTRPSNSVDVPATDTRGRMVRGRGYTRPSGGSDGGSSGSPRGSTSDGSSSGGSSSGSSGGSSSSGGGSEPRTAKPRSP